MEEGAELPSPEGDDIVNINPQKRGRRHRRQNREKAADQEEDATEEKKERTQEEQQKKEEKKREKKEEKRDKKKERKKDKKKKEKAAESDAEPESPSPETTPVAEESGLESPEPKSDAAKPKTVLSWPVLVAAKPEPTSPEPEPAAAKPGPVSSWPEPVAGPSTQKSDAGAIEQPDSDKDTGSEDGDDRSFETRGLMRDSLLMSQRMNMDREARSSQDLDSSSSGESVSSDITDILMLSDPAVWTSEETKLAKKKAKKIGSLEALRIISETEVTETESETKASQSVEEPTPPVETAETVEEPPIPISESPQEVLPVSHKSFTTRRLSPKVSATRTPSATQKLSSERMPSPTQTPPAPIEPVAETPYPIMEEPPTIEPEIAADRITLDRRWSPTVRRRLSEIEKKRFSESLIMEGPDGVSGEEDKRFLINSLLEMYKENDRKHPKWASGDSQWKEGSKVAYDAMQTVRIRVMFNRVNDIDTIGQQFSGEITIHAKWTEPGLKGKSEKELEEIPFDKCWDPRLVILNLSGGMEKERLSIMVRYEEKEIHPVVTYVWAVKAAFSETMELEHFPFDTQELSVVVSSERPMDEIDIVPDTDSISSVHINAVKDAQEWKSFRHVDFTQDFRSSDYNSSSMHPVIIASAHVRRRLGFYMWNVFIIVFLIIGLSLTILSIDPTGNDRLGVTMTLFLTCVAFKLVVKTTLPHVSYLTYLDIYVVFTMMYLAAQAAENAIISHLARFRKREKVIMYDEIAQSTLIGLLILFHAVFLVYIRLTAFSRRRTMTEKDYDFHLQVLKNKNKRENKVEEPIASPKPEKQQPIPDTEIIDIPEDIRQSQNRSLFTSSVSARLSSSQGQYRESTDRRSGDSEIDWTEQEARESRLGSKLPIVLPLGKKGEKGINKDNQKTPLN